MESSLVEQPVENQYYVTDICPSNSFSLPTHLETLLSFL